MKHDDQPLHGREGNAAAGAGQPSFSDPPNSPNLPRTASPRFPLSRRALQVLGVVIVAGALLTAVVVFLKAPTYNGQAQSPAGAAQVEPPSPLFRTWPQRKPEVAIVVSGQSHGYLQECGCSRPQFGGLARRFNLIQSLRDKAWPVVAVDVGDIAQRGGVHRQKLLKYMTTMKALRAMGYTGVGLGQNEFNMPLFEALANYSLENASPAVLAANLLDPRKNYHGMIKPQEIAAPEQGPRVGVIGLIGPTVATAVMNEQYAFARDNAAVVRANLAALAKQNVELVVILYQGTAKEARACAQFCHSLHRTDGRLPRVQLIACLSEDEEPSGIPERISDPAAGETLLVSVGHKGRYVGVVGVFPAEKAGQGPRLEYQLISLSPDFETAPGNEKSNPVMALMEEYAREVKNQNLIAQFPRSRHPIQVEFPEARFIGSESCGRCHEHAYKVWKDSHHSHAYDTLVNKAVNPSLRQFDGECVVCHTVGFRYETGYLAAGNAERRNLQLLHVGCESCHGPGSAHTADPLDPKLHELMNPWKAKPGQSPVAEQRRLNRIDAFCQKCHDLENDVNWTKVPFQSKWEHVIHMTPPAERKLLRGEAPPK